MKTKNAIQYLKQHQNLKYLRVFFDIKMDYGKIFHFAMYLQMGQSLQESSQIARIFLENKNQLNRIYQYVVIGYDKIFDVKQLLSFIGKNTEINFEQDQSISYFTQQI